MNSPPNNCFVCRLFRAFAFSGLGAMLVGYSALFLGASRIDASFWAFGGAMLGMLVMRHSPRTADKAEKDGTRAGSR